jgi:hypothetical protein
VSAGLGIIARVVVEPEWRESAESLELRTAVPAALANAELLREAEERWSGEVVARTSMHDLLFTRPGDVYPFPRFVRVAVDGDAFDFRLCVLNQDDLEVVAEQRTSRDVALATLESFLVRLVAP